MSPEANHFMRWQLIASLFLAACSGTVRSSTATTTSGAAGTSNGQGGTGSSFGGATSNGGNGNKTGVCSDLTYQACQCSDGAPGTQRCQRGTWIPCMCSYGGGSSAGGTAPSCPNLTVQACPCPNGSTGFQRCENSAWSACLCGNVIPGAGGIPNTGVCGDGLIQPGEQCDGQNLPGTCATVSMGACPGGYLICTATCQYDYTACICGVGGVPNTSPVCGDGIVSGAEQCDGQNMPDTCASVSMGACLRGHLICTPNCTYDYTACDCSVIVDGGR